MQQVEGGIADFRSFRAFGKALRFFRRRARLTQAELGRAVGYSREYIAQLEAGRRNPDPSTVAALFIPALDLTHAQAEATHLLELAASARGKTLEDYSIRIQPPVARNKPDASPIDQTLFWYIEMDPEAALRLANALEPMWMARNDYHEARTWFSAILARTTSVSVTRAEALLHASRFAHRQGDPGEAIRYAGDALHIYRSKNDVNGACVALGVLGWAIFDQNQADPRAGECFRECLRLAREMHETRLAMDALLALVHLSTPVSAPPARWAQIESDLNDCERLAQQMNDARGMAYVWVQRGNFEIARSDLPKALQCHLSAQRLFKTIKDEHELGWMALSIGEVFLFMRDCGAARRHLQRGLDLFGRNDPLIGVAMATHHLAQADRCAGRLRAAARRYQESLSINRAQGNRNMVARCVAGLAGVALPSGDAALAARLLGWAQAEIDALPPFLSHYDTDDYRSMAREAQAKLGEAAFQQQWETGRTAPLDALLPRA
jgi:transcriptional regulator with XRE-family HTH domain